jgi:translation initiation factor IF-2
VVHCGVGPISQSDVALAEATGACALIAFNVGRAPASLALQLERARLKVLSHRVIYHLLEEAGALLVGLARGTTVCQVAGQASVLQVGPPSYPGHESGPDACLCTSLSSQNQQSKHFSLCNERRQMYVHVHPC